MTDSSKKTVVVIDDSSITLEFIFTSLREYYNVIPFTSGRDAIDFFNDGQICNLILLDVEMPEFSGFDTIKVLKKIDVVKDIPVIFLTVDIRVKSQLEGLSLGAVDYIYKPFVPELVKKRIDMHIAFDEYNNNLEYLVDMKTRTIERLSDVTVASIISIVGSRDHETSGHISRTSEYVVVLAEELLRSGLFVDKLSGDSIYMLRKSAPLHDVGKVGIDDNILRKPEKLTPDEFEKMKRHTTIGGIAFAKARTLMNEPSFLDAAEQLAMYHHERWDGRGYPRGLKGEEIPLFARIMAIADVYDALISHRPYKEPMTHEHAVEIILEERGTHFDPDICDAFSRIHQTFADIAEKFTDDAVYG